MSRPDGEVREAVIERFLIDQLAVLNRVRFRCKAKKIGGPGWRGWPDRMVLYDGPSTHWLEIKRPKGGKFEPLQLLTHRKLRELGFVVRVVNTKDLVTEYVDDVIRYGPIHTPNREYTP